MVKDIGKFYLVTLADPIGEIYCDHHGALANDTMQDDDPMAVPDCLSCGNCCAWSETWPVLIGDRDGEGIPEDLIDIDNERMQSYGHRCAALEGTLGVRVGCSVYANRPLVCREFEAGSEDCLMVRREFNKGRK